MSMQTSEQVKVSFMSELRALLDKYQARIEAEDHWIGYAECGEDVRMEVDIPAIYDESHECLREATCIDLGNLF